MRAVVLGFLSGLVVVGPLSAQTINGESNYEDGLSHIPPEEMATRLRDSSKPAGPKDDVRRADKGRPTEK